MSRAAPGCFDRLNQHKLYSTSWRNKKRTIIKSTASSSQGQSLNLHLIASITFRAHRSLKHFISPWKKLLLLRLRRGPHPALPRADPVNTATFYPAYALIHIPTLKTFKNVHLSFNMYKGVLKCSKTRLF